MNDHGESTVETLPSSPPSSGEAHNSAYPNTDAAAVPISFGSSPTPTPTQSSRHSRRVVFISLAASSPSLEQPTNRLTRTTSATCSWAQVYDISVDEEADMGVILPEDCRNSQDQDSQHQRRSAESRSRWSRSSAFSQASTLVEDIPLDNLDNSGTRAWSFAVQGEEIGWSWMLIIWAVVMLWDIFLSPLTCEWLVLAFGEVGRSFWRIEWSRSGNFRGGRSYNWTDTSLGWDCNSQTFRMKILESVLCFLPSVLTYH